MNKEEAELEIRRLVGDIDKARLSDWTDEGKASYIESCNRAISRMKKITGPRNIVGICNMVIPFPKVTLKRRAVHQSFDQWKSSENKGN